MEKHEADMLAPTALAFVGDAVHTLYIRRKSVECGYGQYSLHQKTSKYVNAKAQAAVFDAFVEQGLFTDEELELARRAKNAHLHSRAKAASPADYHKATAFESVIGYLDLTENYARRDELLSLAIKVYDEKQQVKEDDK